MLLYLVLVAQVNINYRRGGADLTTAVDGSSTTSPIGDAAGVIENE